MNKNGFLLASETLKIIIAVICIAFLIYFLANLYFSKAGAEKITEAQTNLDRVNDIVLALADGESETQDIPSPEGWYLFGFVGEEKPNSCAGKNCLCICNNVFEYGLQEKVLRQAKKCDEKGACLVVEDLISKVEIEIRGPDDLNFILIKNQGGKILIGENEL